MRKRAVLLILQVFGVFANYCLAGTSVSFANHRTTSLEELKEIDSVVSGNLHLFEHGFFIGTSRGPVLVKANKENTPKSQPRLKPGYYRTLPRLIPAGLEGIAYSDFNLGSAVPLLPPSQQVSELAPSASPLSVAVPDATVSPAPAPIYDHHQHQSSANSQQFIQRRLRPHKFQPELQQRQFVGQPQPQPQSPTAQETFQIDNFLTSISDDGPISFQQISHDPFAATNFIRNPVVERALGLEEALPEHLRNPFYKNPEIANSLAQESLPVEGEEIVGEWDTNKIQKRRIQDLLRSAGFI